MGVYHVRLQYIACAGILAFTALLRPIFTDKSVESDRIKRSSSCTIFFDLTTSFLSYQAFSHGHCKKN